MQDLADQILDLLDRTPRTQWHQALVALLQEHANVSAMAQQIKVGPKQPDGTIAFSPVGRGIRPTDGQAYTLHEPRMLMRSGLGRRRPHRNGTPLTDEEIKHTLADWNADAAKLTRGAQNAWTDGFAKPASSGDPS